MQLYQSACEFCIELGGRPGARFANIYPQLGSRVLLREDGLVALPTLGQLFPGSLLLMPEQHYETCADLPGPIADRMSKLASRLAATSRRFGQPVFFEHGARQDTGGSCGIYHAHLHLIPLPGSVPPGDLFPAHLSVAADLRAALRSLRGCSQYLLAGNEHGVAYARVADMATQPGSQYFRRLLAERFESARPWDWRAFNTPEPDVLTTLDAFDNYSGDQR